MFVRTQEIVVSNPESQVVARTFDVVKTVCGPIRSLVGPVETFDHLLERTEFFRYSIVVGKSDDLGNIELKSITEFKEELLCSQRISTVSVCDETELFRKFFEVSKSHSHGKDAGTDTAVVRYLITDNGAFCGIHDEPDIGFHSADLDIGLVSCQGITGPVIVVVDKGLDADGSGLAVVGDLLVGNGDVV